MIWSTEREPSFTANMLKMRFGRVVTSFEIRWICREWRQNPQINVWTWNKTFFARKIYIFGFISTLNIILMYSWRPNLATDLRKIKWVTQIKILSRSFRSISILNLFSYHIGGSYRLLVGDTISGIPIPGNALLVLVCWTNILLIYPRKIFFFSSLISFLEFSLLFLKTQTGNESSLCGSSYQNSLYCLLQTVDKFLIHNLFYRVCYIYIHINKNEKKKRL